MRAPAGLYVHIPFCSAICPYCDFAVLVGREEKRRAYADTLLREIDLAADFPYAFDTIYFGGGTPSLLDPADLKRVVCHLKTTFRFADDTRLFLEANPEDVVNDHLAAWRELGVATLSLGVQSFDAAELAFLGRRHTAEASGRAVELALLAGFETVSVDLIYGLPHQELAAWRRTLELVTRLGPHHLSCYELEVHERTTFGKKLARGELEELPADAQADFFLETHRFLNEHGWNGYEVSNFSRGDEHRSRHNRKYWYHVPYLGLGVAAHSYDGEKRFWNERLLPRYEKKIKAGERPLADEEVLTENDRALEELMLGFRTYDGIDLEGFEARYGVDLVKTHGAVIERWCRDALVTVEGRCLRPSLQGLAIADALAATLDIHGRRR